MTMSDTTIAILLIITAILLTIGVSITVYRTIASRHDVRVRVSLGDKLFAALCLVLAAMGLSMAWTLLT